MTRRQHYHPYSYVKMASQEAYDLWAGNAACPLVLAGGSQEKKYWSQSPYLPAPASDSIAWIQWELQGMENHSCCPGGPASSMEQGRKKRDRPVGQGEARQVRRKFTFLYSGRISRFLSSTLGGFQASFPLSPHTSFAPTPSFTSLRK